MNKIQKLEQDLKKLLTDYKNPIISWSGGKDSTLLLLLSRQLGYNVPALMFSSLWSRKQFRFITKIIDETGTMAFTYRPNSLRYVDGTIVATYPLGDSEIPVLFDLHHTSARCGLEVGQKALKGNQPMFLWDCVITGSKFSDSHYLVPKLNFTELSLIHTPLWDWTDDEVLGAMIHYGFEVPSYMDEDDPGNFVGCMNCQKSGMVFCPKENREIMGLGE